MAVFVALLRAVNVGGTRVLPMSDLRRVCGQIGFQNVATYIQSGNVVFTCGMTADTAKRRLEAALHKMLGRPAQALLRTNKEIAAILERNPFKDAPPNRLVVLFLESAPPSRALRGLVTPGRERVKLSGREIFIHYPDGMGQSKLKLPFVDQATARNLNTVRRLREISAALSGQ
jgi:uncharacterized protein (DUF1697 family)